MPTKRPNGVFTREDWPNLPGAKLTARRFGVPEVELSCDAVVVGSGAGGGVVAAELAEGGLDVIVLEEGGYHPTEEFTTDEGKMIRKLYRSGGAQMAFGSPPVLFAEGRCVGGSTVINGGMSWRTPDKILERWAREDGVQNILSKDMDRYFDRVEQFLSAKTQDPESIGRDNQLFKQGADNKNWRTVDNVRNQFHCAGTNNCAFGCPTAAKRSTLVSYIPRALAFGAQVLADCKVDRVDRHGKQVTGVTGTVLRFNGRPAFRFHVRAPIVVLSAGAVQTPGILMRSRIKSPSGRIGHDLALHPNTKVIGVFDEDVDGYKGVHQAYQVREFQDEGFVLAAVNVPPSLVAMSLDAYGSELGEILQDYNRMIPAGVLVEDTLTGRVRTFGNQVMAFYQLSDLDAKRLVRGSALLCEQLFAAGAKKVILPFQGIADLHGPDEVKSLYAQGIDKSQIEVATVHVMGTARMGSDPRRHVCDSYGHVYDSEGLIVADASLFPSSIGVNPMQTICTLATRNAEKILERRHRKNALRTLSTTGSRIPQANDVAQTRVAS